MLLYAKQIFSAQFLRMELSKVARLSITFEFVRRFA